MIPVHHSLLTRSIGLPSLIRLQLSKHARTEVTIVTPSYHTRWCCQRFQVNRHGHPEPCRHVNRWTSDDPDPSKRNWLALVRGGDIIQLTPRAGKAVDKPVGADLPLIRLKTIDCGRILYSTPASPSQDNIHAVPAQKMVRPTI